MWVGVGGPGVCRAHGGDLWGGLSAPLVMCCLGAYLRLSVAVVSSSVRLVVACVRSPILLDIDGTLAHTDHEVYREVFIELLTPSVALHPPPSPHAAPCMPTAQHLQRQSKLHLSRPGASRATGWENVCMRDSQHDFPNLPATGMVTPWTRLSMRSTSMVARTRTCSHR